MSNNSPILDSLRDFRARYINEPATPAEVADNSAEGEPPEVVTTDLVVACAEGAD